MGRLQHNDWSAFVYQSRRPSTVIGSAVEPAHVDAQALVLAGRPVRHAAAAPDQGRRPHRRDENQDQSPSANQHSRSSGLALGSRPPVAADHLNTGAGPPPSSPDLATPPAQSQTNRRPPAAKSSMRGHNPKTRQTAHQKTRSLRDA